MRLTLNGSQRITLIEEDSACLLVVTDLDYDADADLVALTAAGRLLVWRNHDGVLRPLPSRPDPARAHRDHHFHRNAPIAESFQLNGRTIPFVVPPGRSRIPAHQVARMVDAVVRQHALAESPSGPRAPPID